jgi:glycosyltransferase involved in cell wall biosynthesis
MLDRLAAERDLRTVALAYPRHGRWWLEMWAGEQAGITALGKSPDVVEAVSSAARMVGTDTVHVENLHGLPLDLIRDLEKRGLRPVLSIHDFVLFCRRPHLIEPLTGGFCEYSRDGMRCSTCLSHDDPGQVLSQAEYRRLGGESLQRAAAVVFPSVFLQQRHHDLFPQRRPDQRETVIAPASAGRCTYVPAVQDLTGIAFVGGAYLHKGGALIPDVISAIRTTLPTATGVLYGNGEAHLMKTLRRDRNLRIRGYYCHGRLANLLARDGIAVAILASIWPEAYALVVDECLAAGVPVVAFDHGAVGERLQAWGVGATARAGTGAAGLASATLDVLRDRKNVPERVVSSLPRPIDAARSHIDLYGELAGDRR